MLTGKCKRTYFQNGGMAAPGQEIPEINSRRYGGEYENQHTGFPVADGDGGGHGKEDAGRQIGER